MRILRLRLPCRDERSLASHLGSRLGSGGIHLITGQVLSPGSEVRFELSSPEGEILFSGEGVAVRAEDDGWVVRYRRLKGPERAVLDRLLLHRDRVGDLSLPRGSIKPLPSSAGSSARGILAIEVGGTLARAALVREGQPSLVAVAAAGATSLPSAVALDEKGRFVLGHRARAQSGIDSSSSIGSPLAFLTLDPRNVQHAAAVNQLPFPVRNDEERGPIADLPLRSVPAIELFAAMAHELKDRAQTAAGKMLPEVNLVCSPVHPPRVRQLLLRALEEAGFTDGRLLDDAVCIAAAFDFSTRKPPAGPLLVLDWGGTTLHVAVLGDVDGRLDVLAAGEKHHLGGAAIDQRIAKLLMDQLEASLGERCVDPLARQRVLEAAETARVTLAHQPEVHVRLPWVATSNDGRPIDVEMTLQAEPVLRSLGPALDQVLRAAQATLEMAGVEPAEVHQVLLAGGQANWPQVVKRLEGRFPGKVRRLPDPGSAAVRGAARLGEARSNHPRPAHRLAEQISVLAADGSLLPLFSTGTSFPAEASMRVRFNGGTGLFCPLIEGEQVSEGYLGAGRLPGADTEVEVSAYLDAAGVLDVRLADQASESRIRLPLRSAGATVETSVFAQRALPGEIEVWSNPAPKGR